MLLADSFKANLEEPAFTLGLFHFWSCETGTKAAYIYIYKKHAVSQSIEIVKFFECFTSMHKLMSPIDNSHGALFCDYFSYINLNNYLALFTYSEFVNAK